MDWDKSLLYELKWCREISNIEEKTALAKKVASHVKDGNIIGFGSGSTSFLAAKEIAKTAKEKKYMIKAIPTSKEIAFACFSLGIDTCSINEFKPDWGFDGADEIDKNRWLIKGRGGAMLNEKLIMANSKITYILADKTKFVDKLCSKFSIPVECVFSSLNYVKQELKKLGGGEIVLRPAVKKDGPVITENGNFIIDVKFDNVSCDLEEKIKCITGVIESGLFINYRVEIL
ncbi:MAG: ribose 5-phosphate isomerase A [Firmicutes bacterium]|nr:ribose 5-phosphate isomerase A [Bacillota bacterium]